MPAVAVPFDVENVTSVASGQEGGAGCGAGGGGGTGQPAVPPVRTIIIGANVVDGPGGPGGSGVVNVPAAKLMTPPTSSSLIVRVAVSRPATRTAPAPGLLSVRF